MKDPFDHEAELKKARAQAPERLAPLVEYLAFAKMPMEKPKPLIADLLDCGSRILFGGGSKTFKTWLQCDLALSLAAGMPWLGFQTHKVRVLYVNLELKDYYMQKRLADIRRAREISLQESALHVWNLRGAHFSRQDLVDQLLELCQKLGIAIVFVDPFYKLLTPLEDENNQTQMGDVLRCFDPVNQADITTAFGIHFSKGNQAAKEPEDRISGAGTIARDADDIITLTKHEQDLAFTLDFIIRDHPPVDSFVVQWESPIMTRTELDPKKIKKLTGREISYPEEDLFDLIRQHDDQCSSKQLEQLCLEQLGWTRPTFYRKLAKLTKAKRVFKSKASENWNVFTPKSHNA